MEILGDSWKVEKRSGVSMGHAFPCSAMMPEFGSSERFQTVSTSLNSPVPACVSFTSLQLFPSPVQQSPAFRSELSSSAALLAPVDASSPGLCNSIHTCHCSPPPLTSLFPSPFSSSSLSSFFPVHVSNQCSASPHCASSFSSPSMLPFFSPTRPSPLMNAETKRTSPSAPIRFSSLASLGSTVQSFPVFGKGFVGAVRDRGNPDREEELDHDVDDTLPLAPSQFVLLPEVFTAKPSWRKGFATFFQQLPREFPGLQKHNFGRAGNRWGIQASQRSSGGRNGKKPDSTIKDGKKKALKTSQHLLAGALAAMVSRTVVAPLERLKLEYLVRGAQGSALYTLHRILMAEGLRGFWKGNGVNILRTAPFKSVNFFAFDMYRSHLLKWGDRAEVSNLERLAAGAAAGVTATVLCFPLDTIRTIMIAPGGEAMGGMVGCFQHMIRTEGFFSLYKGLLPAVMSMAPSGAVFYGVYDMLKMSYLNSPKGKAMLKARRMRAKEEGSGVPMKQLDLGPVRTLLYGAIAGACAESVTYPFEVVRRAQQMQHAAVKMGIAGTVQSLLQKGGVRALYTGLLPSTLQVLPSAALSYFVYETMKIAFKIP